MYTMKKGLYIHLEIQTQENKNFRKVIYTAKHMQLVLMTLLPKQEIGLETHPDNDQFFRFESGEGKVIINESEYLVKDGDSVLIPAGCEHNVINKSETDVLSMYTIYATPHHNDGIVHVTKEDALKDDEDWGGETTE
jgi:mannose-6-phosphate isomerase-like protein (cupin superfamily)